MMEREDVKPKIPFFCLSRFRHGRLGRWGAVTKGENSKIDHPRQRFNEALALVIVHAATASKLVDHRL
jgi:hypothetical protein